MKLNRIARMYEQVARQMREEILTQCHPGDRLESENSLAKKIGVSPVTMRAALLILVREGLIERRPKRGTVVLDRPRHVGILLEADILHPLASNSYRHVVYALREQFEFHKIPVKLYLGSVAPYQTVNHTTCRTFLDAVENGDLSAVIAVASTPFDGWLEKLQARGVPVVGSLSDYPVAVGFPSEEIISRGTDCLLQAGCRRPALLALDTAGDRIAQFAQRLQAFNLPIDLSKQVRQISPGRPGAAWEAVRDLWRSSHRPDGIVIADDTLLPDASLAFVELQIPIPEDLKVVSHQNSQSPVFFPFPFTGIITNSEKWVATAFTMTQTLLAGESLPNSKQKIPLEISPYTPPLSLAPSSGRP